MSRRHKIHHVKCDSNYFKLIQCHKKNFELRYNDRNYCIGDTIFLEEFDNGVYTGVGTVRVIKYVLKDYPGINKDYCILGF